MERALALIRSRHRSDLPLETFIFSIVHASIRVRKVLLTTTRIQPRSFHSSTRWYRRLSQSLEESFVLHDSTGRCSAEVQTLYDFILNYKELFRTPISAGFTSMLIRYLPYADYASVDTTFAETLAKEINAAWTFGLDAPILDFSVIFDKRYGHRFAENISPAPGIASFIHHRLFIGVLQIKRTLLVPKVSTKTFNKEGLECCHEPYRIMTESGEIESLKDVEQVYYWSGGHALYGLTEMRSAWKGNDLKPRVYYARGPSVHRSSVYIQAIFNIFVDCLESTHRYRRFSIHELGRLSQEEILFIYDYSSFTSNLSQLRSFLEALCEYLKEHYVNVLDAVQGVIRVSLGEIIRWYMEDCNTDVEFDCSKVLDVIEAIVTHNTGLLGIPGNISSSTLLHGIHLMMALATIHGSRVVGDDAMGILTQFSTTTSLLEFMDVLSNLGEVSWEKTEYWEHDEEEDEDMDDAWHFVKRPIDRIESRIYSGTLSNYPSINYLLECINPRHRSLKLSRIEVFYRACRQIVRLQDDCASLHITEVDKLVILTTLDSFRRHWNLVGKFTKGYIGIFRMDDDTRMVYIPALDEHFFDFYFLDICRSFPNVCIEIPDPYSTVQVNSSVGGDVVSYSTDVVSYMVTLGLLKKVERVSTYALIGDLDDETLENFRFRNFRYMYHFVVRCTLPPWSRSYLNDLVPS